MNTNRDAANPGILAEAAIIWLASTNMDEADIAFEAVLLEEGVMAPHDAIDSIVAQNDTSIMVTFDNMDIVAINAITGAVTAVE